MKVFATSGKNSGKGFKVGTTKTKNSTVVVRERGKVNVGAANAIRNVFANLIQRAGNRLSASGNALRRK